jgi:hypothetical protein
VRTISNVGDRMTFQRFVELCAGRTAQLLNYSSLAADCGISLPSFQFVVSANRQLSMASEESNLPGPLKRRG